MYIPLFASSLIIGNFAKVLIIFQLMNFNCSILSNDPEDSSHNASACLYVAPILRNLKTKKQLPTYYILIFAFSDIVETIVVPTLNKVPL